MYQNILQKTDRFYFCLSFFCQKALSAKPPSRSFPHTDPVIIFRKAFPDTDVRITYGTKTKLQRRTLDIMKSHVNDAYTVGDFRTKHRAHPVIFQKKRRNNRILEKFYDVKYIDNQDGSKKTGQQLCNGRTNRSHNTDTENLRKYRRDKVSKGRRVIRTTRYGTQPHDIIVCQDRSWKRLAAITKEPES